MSDKPYLLDGHMYQYDLGWMISIIEQQQKALATALDAQTITYADPIQWDITTQYAAITIVVDPQTGTAYISKQAVPQGILLTNTDYWLPIFNYQAGLTQVMQGITISVETGTTATKDYLVNDLLWYKSGLYRVTRALAVGDDLTPNYNIIETSVESLLTKYYGRDRIAQVANDTIKVSGDYALHAGNITETAENITLHSTKDTLIDADGKYTEQITGNREIDVDGSDSTHVDGVSNINRGGAVTEVYGSSVDKTVNGTDTEIYKDTATSTYQGRRVINAKNIDVTSADKSLPIHFPDKTIDLYNVSDSEKITSAKTVFDFGAVGDGVTDDTNAFVEAAKSNDVILVPPASYYCTESIDLQETNAIFIVDSAVTYTNVTPIEGPNINGRLLYSNAADHDSVPGHRTLGIYNLPAGTKGYVQTPNWTHAIIRSATNNFIWGNLTVVDIGKNIVNDAENAAVYGQINGDASSDTGMWGACFELTDKYPHPKMSKIGLELTYKAAEGDSNKSRNVIHAALSAMPNSSGAQINAVLLVSGERNVNPKVNADSCILLDGVNYNTLIAGARDANRQRPKCSIGIDFTNIDVAYSAIKLENKKLQFNTVSMGEINGDVAMYGPYHTVAVSPTIETVTKTATGRYIPVNIDGSQFWIPLYQ